MNNIKEKLELDEKNENSFANIQAEKNFFLGEYKERVLGALTKSQIMEDDVYLEALLLMESPNAFLLKLSRDVDLKRLKPYIQYAEKLGLKNQLVDGINYFGEIGLVIVSKEALEKQSESLIIRDVNQDFLDAGYDKNISRVIGKANGKSICVKHYKEFENKLPNYVHKFKKINLFEKLIGIKCPICKAEKGNRRK